MSVLTAPNQSTPLPSAEFITGSEAEKYSTLSLKTLQRRQANGCDTGLRKHGRRIVFHVPTLRKFLSATTYPPHPDVAQRPGIARTIDLDRAGDKRDTSILKAEIREGGE